MKNEGLTALQREALEHLEKARREGLSVSAYARAHGIPAQRIFDATGRLRRRGALPGKSAKGGRFIAVKIAPPPSVSATVCRISVPGGLILECQQWPRRSEETVLTLSGEPLNWLLDGYDVWRMKPHEALHFSVFS